MAVSRWDCDPKYGPYKHIETEGGDYVFASDYDALAKQVSTLTADVDTLTNRAEHAERRADDLQAQLIASELRCQRLKASLDESEKAWEELAPAFREIADGVFLSNAGFYVGDGTFAREQIRKAKERSKKNEG